MGLYTHVLSQRFPTDEINMPMLTGWFWYLMVDRERNAWNAFAQLIEALKPEYTHFTVPTPEFYQRMQNHAAKIFSDLKLLKSPILAVRNLIIALVPTRSALSLRLSSST